MRTTALILIALTTCAHACTHDIPGIPAVAEEALFSADTLHTFGVDFDRDGFADQLRQQVRDKLNNEIVLIFRQLTRRIKEGQREAVVAWRYIDSVPFADMEWRDHIVCDTVSKWLQEHGAPGKPFFYVSIAAARIFELRIVISLPPVPDEGRKEEQRAWFIEWWKNCDPYDFHRVLTDPSQVSLLTLRELEAETCQAAESLCHWPWVKARRSADGAHIVFDIRIGSA